MARIPANDKIVAMLRELAEIEDNTFKGVAYERAKKTVLAIDFEIVAGDSRIRSLAGIGVKIADKIETLLKTGTLARLQDAKSIIDLKHVFGIGPVAAKKLLARGISSVQQLRIASAADSTLLTAHQKIGLDFVEEFANRIPRQEIQLFERRLNELLQPRGLNLTICGSYRREQADSGDVDVLLTGETVQPLHDIITSLQNAGIITHVLALGDTKSMAVGQVDRSKPHRRIDFRLLTPAEYWFGVLYFTGSDQFNKRMRKIAIDRGFKLNEYSLTPPPPIKIESERDIFDALGMEWVEPKGR